MEETIFKKIVKRIHAFGCDAFLHFCDLLPRKLSNYLFPVCVKLNNWYNKKYYSQYYTTEYLKLKKDKQKKFRKRFNNE